jgi:serine O-acetyltransferase
MKWLHRRHVPVLPGLICKYIRVFYACDLPVTVELGERVRFPHNGLGVVLHSALKTGDDCTIYQNVTVGGSGSGHGSGVPVLEKGVTIYAGAVILGRVLLGEGAVIGANAVVLASVPAHGLAVGVPARIIQRQARPHRGEA